MRTTSSLESLHSALNRSFKQKEHYFKFIECLRLHESRKADQFFNLLHGLPATRFQRNFKNQRREIKIKYFTDLLVVDKTITVEQFLHGMANDQDCMYDLKSFYIFFAFFSSTYTYIVFTGDLHEFDDFSLSSDDEESDDN